MPERDRVDPDPRATVPDEHRSGTPPRAGRRGFMSGASEALPLVVVVGLVGATFVAGMHAAGADAATSAALVGSALAVLGVGVVLARAVGDRVRVRGRARARVRAARPRSPRSTGRFSRGPYAVTLLFGIAGLVAVFAYLVVDPLFTRGRHGRAAILVVIGAPMFAVLWLYDPLAASLDRFLDRLASLRAGPRVDRDSKSGEGPLQP